MSRGQGGSRPWWRRTAWWLAPVLAVAAGGLGFLAWSFRPLPEGQDGSSYTPLARPTLLGASSSAALVQRPGSKTGPPWTVVAWSRDGRQLWSNRALAERMSVVCLDLCRSAIGTATAESYNRPEVADPPPLAVPTDDQRTPRSPQAPRMRLLAAGPGADEIIGWAEHLGTPLSIDSVHGGRRLHLAWDPFGDAFAYLSGDHGAVFVRASATRATVVPLVHGSNGWRASGSPVAVASIDGACFGEVGGRPLAVMVGGDRPTWLRNGRVAPFPHHQLAGMCVISRAGIVLSAMQGPSTQVQLVGFDGRSRWEATVVGQGSVTADTETGTIAVADSQHDRVTFIDGLGHTVRTVPGVAAQVVGREVVVVDATGRPTWMSLP